MSHPEKPWFFKAGRLNMMSGEPLGIYFHCPLFTVCVSQFGVTFPS